MKERSLRRAEAEAASILDCARIAAPPIPVERLARELGARLRFEPFEGELSGLLFREDGRVIIGVNALHQKARQRFTVAHEIGHLVLHEHNPLHIDRHFRVRHRDEVSAQGIDQAEIEANAFAAALLMPRTMLEVDLQEQALDLEDDDAVRRLAQRYRVSLQALILRLTNRGFLG